MVELNYAFNRKTFWQLEAVCARLVLSVSFLEFLFFYYCNFILRVWDFDSEARVHRLDEVGDNVV